MITCTRCKEKKNTSEFSKNIKYKTGYATWCHTCQREYYQQNKDKIKTRNRERAYEVKLEVLKHYGNVCACCGEDVTAFLTMDHIKGDGNQHRKEIKCSSGKDTYFWLKKNKYPKDFQILCFNCNCGRSVNGGECPHKTGRIK